MHSCTILNTKAISALCSSCKFLARTSRPRVRALPASIATRGGIRSSQPLLCTRPFSRSICAQSQKQHMDSPPMHAFRDVGAMETFFAQNHSTLPELILKLAKKASGIATVSRDEAIDVALCYGWIDGIGRSVDENWYSIRFTPRRAKSMWSEKNVDAVTRLVAAGRMHAAGLAAVDAAKADGRWERAYPRPSTITEPPDFKAALAKNPTAAAFYATLNRGRRYSVLWRVLTASPTARAARIVALVNMLEQGTTPHVHDSKKKKHAVVPTSAKQKPAKVVKVKKAPKGSARKAQPAKSTASREPNMGSASPSIESASKVQPSRRQGLRPRN